MNMNLNLEQRKREVRKCTKIRRIYKGYVIFRNRDYQRVILVSRWILSNKSNLRITRLNIGPKDCKHNKNIKERKKCQSNKHTKRRSR